MCHLWLQPLCHGSITSAMNLSQLHPFCPVSLTALPVFHAALTAPRPQACTTCDSTPSAMYLSWLCPSLRTTHSSAPSALYHSWLPALFTAPTPLLCTTYSSTPSAQYLSQLHPLRPVPLMAPCTFHGSDLSVLYHSRLHTLCPVPLTTPPPLPCKSACNTNMVQNLPASSFSSS